MNPPDSSNEKPGSAEARRESIWRRVLGAKEPAHRRLYAGVTCALVAVIGFADYLSGFELSLLVFYFVPVCMAVATVGWRFGIATAVASVATWLVGDILAGAHFASSFVPVWNALIALGTYLVVVWLLASLIALHREMEERVRERTRALTDEIAERVRLEKVVLETTERERRTIGHELHDGLSQHLTGTALVAQALRAKLASNSSEGSADAERIVGLIEQGIEQTRSLAKGLLLAEIERDGLITALQDLAAKTRVQSRVDCQFSSETSVDLGESGTATHLYRIAEEATRNAVRHGRARRVAIALSSDAEGLVLAVRDDGSGLSPAPSRGHGLGLRIMAHRAAIIGASFSIEAQPGGGTCVTCRLPSRAQAP